MENTNLLYIIAEYAVIWNAILQSFWFIWSYSIQKRKHKEDIKNKEENSTKNTKNIKTITLPTGL